MRTAAGFLELTSKTVSYPALTNLKNSPIMNPYSVDLRTYKEPIMLRTVSLFLSTLGLLSCTGNTDAEDADVRHEERQEDQSDANPWDDLGFGLLLHWGGRNKTGAVRHLRLFVHRRGLRLGHNSGRLICWNPLGSVPHPLAVFA